jgi:hypothetical protein
LWRRFRQQGDYRKRNQLDYALGERNAPESAGKLDEAGKIKEAENTFLPLYYLTDVTQ